MRNAAFSLGRIFAWLGLLAFVLFLFGLLSEFMREQQEIHHHTRPDPGTFSVWQWGSLAIVRSTVASVIARRLMRGTELHEEAGSAAARRLSKSA